MPPRSANVVRPTWPPEPGKLVNLYLGSGRFGACFNAAGLMDAAPADGVIRTGQTCLMHADHWHAGVYGIDQQVPVACIHWSEDPGPQVRCARQELDIGRGLLSTELQTASWRGRMRASFHPDERDVLCLDFELNGRPPAIVVAPVRAHRTCYDEPVAGAPARWRTLGGGLWLARVRLGTADSALLVRILGSDTGRIAIGRGALIVTPRRGCARFSILIASVAWSRRDEAATALAGHDSAEGFLVSAAAAWRHRWGRASLSIPERAYESLWWHSHYHILCSYAPEARCPAPPMGWTGNSWGHHFPQDLSYIHPALLRLGHLDIARAFVEFYASRLAQMHEATQRIFNAKGAFWAWEFPIGATTRILPDGKTPNAFQYELHNAAYPARMAAETARLVADRDWGRAIAWPVVLESARFFASLLRRGRDGRWGIHVHPSMGQDEFGGENAPDYLCALFAAEYTLRAALRLARTLGLRPPVDEAAAWRRMLHDGLAYPRLLRPTLGGIYATSARRGYALGRQKHPVQLNPLTFLPLGRFDLPTRAAYRLRHAICCNEREGMHHPGTRGSFYNGWTLAAYWLAAARAGDAPALEHELRQTAIAQYVDTEWIQLYESSGFWCPYYTTSMGLYLQALNDAFLSDYFGSVQVGRACPPNWDGASFSNFLTGDGVLRSGQMRQGSWRIDSGHTGRTAQ